jgi:hypothetical protein
LANICNSPNFVNDNSEGSIRRFLRISLFQRLFLHILVQNDLHTNAIHSKDSIRRNLTAFLNPSAGSGQAQRKLQRKIARLSAAFRYN